MTIELSIHRYNPEESKAPYWQRYMIDPEACKGNMLLDALEAAKLKDPTLTFRRSCGQGVCGSDGMSINGKNGLACITPLADLPKKITLRPLPSFPIIKDLVVDLTNFYRQLESIKPYLKNDDPAPLKERLQTPEQRAQLDGLYECILCACCTSACPSAWWNPEKFAGPAALLAANRFLSDNRDTAEDERLADLNDLFKLYRCRGINNCSNTCPKGLEPSKAISHIRRRMVSRAK